MSRFLVGSVSLAVVFVLANISFGQYPIGTPVIVQRPVVTYAPAVVAAPVAVQQPVVVDRLATARISMFRNRMPTFGKLSLC